MAEVYVKDVMPWKDILKVHGKVCSGGKNDVMAKKQILDVIKDHIVEVRQDVMEVMV